MDTLLYKNSRDDFSILQAPLQALNFKRSEPETGDALVVIGFGTTSFEGDLAETLQRVDLKMIDFETCRTNYAAQKLIVDEVTMFCSGGKNRGSCQGDSGS
jgi:secreted trypsin-like serine protease